MSKRATVAGTRASKAAKATTTMATVPSTAAVETAAA